MELALVGLAASVDPSNPADSLLLPFGALTVSGVYEIANLRLVAQGRSVLDVAPSRVPVQVIEQVLITSVTSRPLTLDEIKNKGIVLDSDDYLGFEFTMGIKLESRPVQLPLPEFTRINPTALSPEVGVIVNGERATVCLRDGGDGATHRQRNHHPGPGRKLRTENPDRGVSIGPCPRRTVAWLA